MSLNKRLVAEIIDSKSVLIMVVDQNIISAEFTALDRGSLTNVAEWGIYVNRGSISFIDRTGFFDSQTVNKAWLLGYTVKFYLADKNSQYIIGTFKVQSASLNEETREVTIECISKLEELQRKERSTPVYPFEERSADLLLDDIIKQYNQDESDNMRYIQFGKDTQKLESTIIYCPYLGKESLWASIEKICQATMCRCYDNKNGNAIIDGSFPVKTPIIVNPSNIIDITDQAYVWIPNPSIEVTNRAKIVENTPTGNRLEDAYANFEINYGENGKPVSVNDCNYKFDIEDETYYFDSNLTIKKYIRSNYKIHQTSPSIWITKDIEEKSGNVVHNYSRHNQLFYDSSQGTSPDDEDAAETIADYSGISLTMRIRNMYSNVDDGVQLNPYKITRVSLDFYADHFRDSGSSVEKIISSETEELFNIPSNDLIHTGSYYVDRYGYNNDLGYAIVSEVLKRYGDGIECFEIECLFNDYYYDTGVQAFDKNDLSSHFEKYDVIIPYVQKQGQKVPLRKNADGTPKKFRIIGISYLYDGLLRQRLQVQEDIYA